MVEARAERRLAAIVAIDVAGYSRLMGADEEGTLATLKAHRDTTDPIGLAHGGRIVGEAGDGILFEFPSVVEAVSAAVEVQAIMAARNADVSDEKKMLFRIGINLGDVLVDGDNIFGDGVNVAARLETLAPPGGICVSRTVRNQVRDRMGVEFEDLGEIEVKNIARPVKVFRVLRGGEAVKAPKKHFPTKWMFAAAAAVMLVLLIGGGVWWWQLGPTDPAKMTYKLPDKPSIAVLPFTNLSDDKTQQYFADGMAEDIITDLSKVSGLFVIARNSSFRYRGGDQDLKLVGQKLGVRYVLEGSVRRVGQQVRINVQLIDTTTEGHLWAERYDGALEDVFAFQDQVRVKIVSALAVRLNQREELAVARPETEIPEAYDRFLQGWQRYRERTPQAFTQAIANFTEAVDLDPGYARAYAALASTYWEIWERGWHRNLNLTRRAARRKSVQYLERALKKPTALAHQVASEMHRQDRRFEKAIAEAEAGIALDPNDANGYVTLAGTLIMVGRAEEAVNLTRKAMRLDPHYPAFYLYVVGVASFGKESYAEAADYLVRAAKRNPENHALLVPLVAAYGKLGREKAAVEKIELYVKLRGLPAPPTVKKIISGWPFQSERDRERMADGLRKAGLPED